jgi:NAD(P)-dependent dehydrogenase (short-subunit alcohol dehydrogenase family)
MKRLQDKVAVITGGGSFPGLGEATAKLFAREGATVVITDVDQAGARQRVEEIAADGGTALALAHDVTSESRWVEILDTVVERFGRIDVLVNNAGIRDETPSLENLTLENWNRQVSINLTGVFLGCKHVIPHMRRTGAGSIVNLSSVGGLVGIGNGAYGATKGGVRILSKAVGVTYGRENIRCNSVHPGVMQTGLTQAYFDSTPETAKAVAAAIPMGRTGEPDDIAHCVLYLASDESRYVTGAEFVVDGGQSAI